MEGVAEDAGNQPRMKPRIFRWNRVASQPLWCIDWGKGYIQVAGRFDFALRLLGRIREKAQKEI